MNIMVIGASRGLGRAFVEGLYGDGHAVIGVSRNKPHDLDNNIADKVDWISVDMSATLPAIAHIESKAPDHLDVIIYNLGIWEERAFEDDYSFYEDSDERIMEMIGTNITSAILLLKRMIPRMLTSPKPQIILTGSTSGLPQSGRPEVTFGASKFALKGISEGLRESFREDRLAVTCLQLGYLNTEDGLVVPARVAAQRGRGQLIPVHDVVDLTRALLNLSDASFVKEIVVPAILDERF